MYAMFIGCYNEGMPRDLWGFETTAVLQNASQCIEVCASKGYVYAAVQSNNRCSCGVSYGRYGKADPIICSCKMNSSAVYKTGNYDLYLYNRVFLL
jgi:hypothetical protein